MEPSAFRNYHRRKAARLRSLLTTASTPALQARLLKDAEEHERLAQLDDEVLEPQRAS
jgi:hypothetical protein